MTTAPLPTRYDLPPLARIETNWCPPWLIARLAQHGPWHYSNGDPMDDSHIIGGTSGAFWMVAADGVGSQPRSRFGARAACLAVETHLAIALDNGQLPSRRLLVDAFAAAHSAIHALATHEGHPPQTYATTLAAALIKGDAVIGAVVGDSSIAVGTDHEDQHGKPHYQLTPFCSAAQPGGRGTFAIADPNWPSYIASNECSTPHIKTILIATDGANTFFLDGPDFREEWPAAIDTQLRQLTPLSFVNFLAHFIRHQPPENNDDRTLLIACRPPADIAPPAPKPR